jgi:hypothetical protein
LLIVTKEKVPMSPYTEDTSHQPANPDADADPQEAPDWMPDTSRGLPADIGTAMGEWALRQAADRDAELDGPEAG